MPNFAEYISLKPYTTYKIGGAARHFCTAETSLELLDALRWCRDNGVPWFLLGGGSNLLISDLGFPGLVITLGGEFRRIKLDQEDGFLRVGGGVMLPKLGMSLVTRGWTGFEFMCGIPGTVGGAVRINAGAKDGETKDHFVSASVMTPTCERETIGKEEMGFSYRHSNLVDRRDILMEATFRLDRKRKEDVTILKSRVRRRLADRRCRQPKNKKNCGSVFKNPPGEKPAGWYLERAGLKGKRIGAAMVAEEHANWIVNLDNATSQDVERLIGLCQEQVFKEFGILLKREVMFIPKDLN
jgi:UDP-N-acetylmuramate dehydrogenase